MNQKGKKDEELHGDKNKMKQGQYTPHNVTTPGYQESVDEKH